MTAEYEDTSVSQLIINQLTKAEYDSIQNPSDTELYLVTDEGDTPSSVDIDDKTITLNSSDEIQTVAVLDDNDKTNGIKTWTGTRAQYDAITTKDPYTLYNITDDIDSFETYPSRVIGQIIQSSIPIVDAGLHLLDGSVLIGNGIYADFVSYIGNLSSSYPNLFVTESEWQNTVSTYGACGKFVYNSTANTVRLPKLVGFVEGAGGISALGDLTEAGLPNITGFVSNAKFESNEVGGAFYSTTGAGNVGGDVVNTNGHIFYLDASRSSSIYGNSSTVQPQSIKVLYYIVVATSARTDLTVDIDEIATDLSNKMDKDGKNATCSICVESYVNGTSWYRVYSDGWCEQGGDTGAIGTGGSTSTTTFLKPFIDTNYTLVFGTFGAGFGGAECNFRCTAFTNTSCTFYNNSGTATNYKWRACGYIS